MLEELVYGNPNRSYLIYLETENYLDSLLNELQSYPFPPNDSEETAKEIYELSKNVAALKDNPAAMNRFLNYDLDFETFIIQKMKDAGLPEKDVRELVINLHKDIVPLLVKLKYHYNRPRPFQVAYYKKLSFYPYKSYSADSPSYPAGHAFQARIYAEVLGNTYPKFYQALKELSYDIATSREYLGVHYHSDIEFAAYCADTVLKHPDFVKKYKL
jgi:hypothetical protein